MWLKIGVLISVIVLFSGCSEEKERSKPVKTEKEKAYDIPWEKDLESAFKKAKKEHKKIIIMAVSKHCKWCNKIKEETLSDPKILKKLNNYLLVKIDRETPTQREQVPKFEHVPVFFFATAEKKFYDELTGYFTTKEFLAALKEVEELE